MMDDAYDGFRWPKHCGCGEIYSIEAWIGLPRIGVQDMGMGEALELRVCPCLSSIGVPVHALADA